MPLNYLCILQIARIIPFYLYYPRGKLNFRTNFEKHIILRVTYLGVFSSQLVKSSFYPFICSLPPLTCVVIHSMSFIEWYSGHTITRNLHELWTSNQQISHSNYILIRKKSRASFHQWELDHDAESVLLVVANTRRVFRGLREEEMSSVE